MIRRATVGLTRTLFRVHPGEGERVLLMLAFSLLAVGGIVITGQLIGRSLFLSRLPASAIPLRFVMPPLVLVGAVALFTRLAQRMRNDRLVVLTFGAILAGVIGMRLLLSSALGETLPFLLTLFVFFEIAGSLTMILFWILAGDLFNAREAKRLFGIIAGGSAISNIAFGAFLGRMAATSPPESLFWVIVVSVMLSLGIVVHLVRRYPSASAADAAPTQEQPQKQSTTQSAHRNAESELGWFQRLRDVLQSPLTMTIASIVVVVALVSGIADYQLDLALKSHYADNGQGMVQLLAWLRLGSGVVAFVLQLVLAGFLMQRFGILTVLMLLPLAMAGGATGILLTGGALWAVMIPRGADIALKYTIHDSAFNMLYLPLPPAMRARTKAVVDGMLKPVLVGLLGLAFLAVGRIEGVSLLYWSPPMLLLVVLWIGLLVRASRCYIDALSQSLVMRRLDLQSASFDLTDETSARVLATALTSTDGLRVLHTLALLRLSEADWSERVLALLGHQNPEVRIAAAEYLGDRGNAEAAADVGKLLLDAEPRVRRAAVEASGALLGTGSVSAIVDHLQDPDRAVRGTAIVTLIRRGGLAGFLHAGRPLNELLESEDALERIQGATLLGELAVPSFYEPLAELLEDPSLEVVLAAVRASARVAAPELIPALRATLVDARLRRDAAQAIVACAGTDRKILEELLDDPAVPAPVRADLAAALAGCGPGATQELISRLDHPEPAVRGAVFRALQGMQEAGDLPAIDRAKLDASLENELRVAFERLVRVHDLRDVAGVESLLAEALAERVHDDEDRVLSLLPLLYPNLPIAPLREALRHPHERVRANAVELMDNVVDSSKRLLIPYVGGNDAQKLDAARSILRLENGTATQRLRELIEQTDPWLRACALQMLVEVPSDDSQRLIKTAEQALDSTDEIVRLTAHRTLERLGRPRPVDMDVDLDKENPMALAPLEKVLFLKQVPLFHEITGEEIASILPLAEEVTFERGTEIIRQNDSGDALYIIVEGEVGIAIDGRPTDGTLGSRAVIGELSILTGDPRAATCTAMTEVLALRIQREPFWKLMRERPEVTIGVVQILLGYLAKDQKASA